MESGQIKEREIKTLARKSILIDELVNVVKRAFKSSTSVKEVYT
jgi:hypothetical protein